MNLLMLLFVIPFLTSIVAFMIPLSGTNLKRLAFLMSLIPLAILIYGHTTWIGSNVQYPWLPPLSINFHLSVDELSLVFLYLTAVIIPISILATHNDIAYPNVFYGLVLFLEGLL